MADTGIISFLSKSVFVLKRAAGRTNRPRRIVGATAWTEGDVLRQLGLLTNSRSLMVLSSQSRLVVERAGTGEQVALPSLSDLLLGARLELPRSRLFCRDQPHLLTLESTSGVPLRVGVGHDDKLVFRQGRDAFDDPASWKRIGPGYRPLTLRRQLLSLLYQ